MGSTQLLNGNSNFQFLGVLESPAVPELHLDDSEKLLGLCGRNKTSNGFQRLRDVGVTFLERIFIQYDSSKSYR